MAKDTKTAKIPRRRKPALRPVELMLPYLLQQVINLLEVHKSKNLKQQGDLRYSETYQNEYLQKRAKTEFQKMELPAWLIARLQSDSTQFSISVLVWPDLPNRKWIYRATLQYGKTGFASECVLQSMTAKAKQFLAIRLKEATIKESFSEMYNLTERLYSLHDIANGYQYLLAKLPTTHVRDSEEWYTQMQQMVFQLLLAFQALDKDDVVAVTRFALLLIQNPMTLITQFASLSGESARVIEKPQAKASRKSAKR